MFVTNCISTTKIQKISEITNFFRHYFLSRTEVYIYIFYTIRNMGGKRFFFNKSAFKMHFFSSKICISLK